MKVFGLAFWEEMSRGLVRISKQFPLAVLCGFVCAIAWSLPIDDSLRGNDLWQERWLRLAITSGFGISLFICVELISDFLGGRKSPESISVSGVSLFFLVLLYRWIPVEGSDSVLNIFWIRFLMLGAIVHLCIAVLPYWKSKN